MRGVQGSRICSSKDLRMVSSEGLLEGLRGDAARLYQPSDWKFASVEGLCIVAGDHPAPWVVSLANPATESLQVSGMLALLACNALVTGLWRILACLRTDLGTLEAKKAEHGFHRYLEQRVII